MALSGLLMLEVKCVGKFSLSEGVLIVLFLVFLQSSGEFRYSSVVLGQQQY